MRVAPCVVSTLVAVACVACGGTTAHVVTRTVGVTPSTCAPISESPILLCELEKPRFRTAFFTRRGGRLVPLHVQAPGRVGHWVTAFLSPDGRTLLAQWSAECEVPVTYFVPARGGKARPVGGSATESLAKGWQADGRAIVEFPKPACGAGIERSGLYLVSLDGERELLVPRTGSG